MLGCYLYLDLHPLTFYFRVPANNVYAISLIYTELLDLLGIVLDCREYIGFQQYKRSQGVYK